jgi:succinate dehydrogenase hydrophobic anchor subunit
VSTIPNTKGYVAYVVFLVGFFLAIPLWREFQEPNQPIWNVFLAAILVLIVAGAFLGIRHLQNNDVDVGEARFTSEETDRT